MSIDNYTDRERELRCAVADLQAENKALQDMLAQQAAMVEKCMVAMNENADRGEKAEAKLAALEKQTEQLRVQLAGCGVAAMQNTEASKAERAKRGDFGWSESYGDVCRMVDREIAQRTVMQQALDALELHATQYPHMQKGYTVDAITALKEAMK